MVKSENIDCIWHLLVKKCSARGEDEGRNSHLEGGPTGSSYTTEHLNERVGSLSSVNSEEKQICGSTSLVIICFSVCLCD
jgi:hypothetical protein